MKKNLINLITLSAICSLLNACTKPSSTNNNNNNNSTPTASAGTVIVGSKTFTVKSVGSYGIYRKTGFSLTVDCSNADSAIALTISSADYLPASGTYALENNIIPLAASKLSYVLSIQTKVAPFTYYQESSVATKSGDIVVKKGTNDIQFFTNKSQGFKLDASAGSLISFNINKANPSIPAANMAFTVPTGLSNTTITIGSNVTWNHSTDFHQVDAADGLCKAKVTYEASLANAKSLTFNFSDGLPPSGTYDVVTSAAALSAGKVYIEYVGLPATAYTSTGTGKLVVENNNGALKLYAKTIAMGAGGDLNGLIEI